MAKLSENAVAIIEALKGNGGVTVHELAATTGLKVSSITGTFNSLVKKGLGVREESSTEADGAVKVVKTLSLTDVGMTFDLAADAELEA